MTFETSILIVLFFVVFSFMLGVIVKNIEQINNCREKRIVKPTNVSIEMPIEKQVDVISEKQVDIPLQQVNTSVDDNYDIPVIVFSTVLNPR